MRTASAGEQGVDLVELPPVGHPAAVRQREDELAGKLGALVGHSLVEARHDSAPVDPLAVAAPEHCQGDELVVAKAGHDVGIAKREAQHVGDRHDKSVAGGVTAPVVHVVQSRKLGVQHEHLGAQSARALARLADRSEEAAPAQKAGELVGVSPAA